MYTYASTPTIQFMVLFSEYLLSDWLHTGWMELLLIQHLSRDMDLVGEDGFHGYHQEEP